MNPAANTTGITGDMTVRDIITLFPAAADIMIEYGLHCFSCSVGGVETLVEGCRIHGFEDETIEALISDINDARNDAPARPHELHVTEAAARGVLSIMEAEGKTGTVLRVTLDETGGFCMEFCENVPEGDLTFGDKSVPEVVVTSSPLTLSRIGGATIDMRDGRFKLDLPESGGCCGGDEGACGCGEKKHT